MNNLQKTFLGVFVISLIIFLFVAYSNYSQWKMIFYYWAKNKSSFYPVHPIYAKIPHIPAIASFAVSVCSLIGVFFFKDK